MEVCVKTANVVAMNLVSSKVVVDNGFSGIVLEANPNRVYLEFRYAPTSRITFGEVFDSGTGLPPPYIGTLLPGGEYRAVFEKTVPVDAVYMQVDSGHNGSIVIYEGTTPEET